MSWQERSPQQRAALKSRRVGRRTRSERLESQHWAEREQLARAPEDKVAVEYDRARKNIRKVRDPGKQDGHWRALVQALAEFNRRFGGDGR